MSKIDDEDVDLADEFDVPGYALGSDATKNKRAATERPMPRTARLKPRKPKRTR